MRTWLSKTMGYVSEMPNDAFTGYLSETNEKIFVGDKVRVRYNRWVYTGKYNDAERIYKDKKHWELKTNSYEGTIEYNEGYFGFYRDSTDWRNRPCKKFVMLERGFDRTKFGIETKSVELEFI